MLKLHPMKAGSKRFNKFQTRIASTGREAYHHVYHSGQTFLVRTRGMNYHNSWLAHRARLRITIRKSVGVDLRIGQKREASSKGAKIIIMELPPLRLERDVGVKLLK